MKYLLAIVKPFRAEAVMEVLVRNGIEDFVVGEVKGYGRQKLYLHEYESSALSSAFLPKVRFEFCATDQQADTVIEQIAAVARTGRIGDGKLFVTQATAMGSGLH